MRMTKQAWVTGCVGLLCGALIILGVRFFTYNPEQIHYHANFAAYINGQRELFKSPMYYEEEAGGSCTLSADVKPSERAHMHDNMNDLIHVHDHAVTWGDFFMNLGWAVGPDFIRTPDGIYVADASHQITYEINGHAVSDISTVVIKDQDRLLIDYGDTTSATIQKEMNSVARTAHQYDVGKDPASCKGLSPTTWKDRLKHLF